VVALHAADGGVDDVDGCAGLLDYAIADALDCLLAGFGVADDSTLADVEAAGLELGLDEDYGFALPGAFWTAERRNHGWQDERGGDEGYVHCDEDRGWGVEGEEFAGDEEAGVGALAQGDTGVVAKLLSDLAVAGVDSQDRLRAVLQHAVGEASGGGADVDAGEAGEVDGPVFEGALEFEAAAADVLEVGAEEADDAVGGDGGSWLVDALLANEDAAGEDEGLGPFARGGVALVDKQLVEAEFFSARLHGVGHELDSGRRDNGGDLHNATGCAALKGVAHAKVISDRVAGSDIDAGVFAEAWRLSLKQGELPGELNDPG
jgi:hypothetical protein